MRSSLGSLFAVVLWSSVALAAGPRQYPRPELLVEPAELAKPEAARQFIVLDVRTREQYDRGHLPGARRVDHDAWKSAWGEGRDAAGWSKRIGQLGIAPGSKVVLYDDVAMKNAARIWWILKFWGVQHARLLHGGWPGWESAGLPTTIKVPAAAIPNEFKATPHAGRLTTMEGILPTLGGGKLQIVDTRSEDEFCGIAKQSNKKGGAIPGAKHLEWSDLIDQETHRFKGPGQLDRLFNRAGIELDRPTATHCQSGGRASVMAFALELMGAEDVRNYYAGWSEWGNAEATPVVQRP